LIFRRNKGGNLPELAPPTRCAVHGHHLLRRLCREADVEGDLLGGLLGDLLGDLRLLGSADSESELRLRLAPLRSSCRSFSFPRPFVFVASPFLESPRLLLTSSESAFDRLFRSRLLLRSASLAFAVFS